MALVEHMARWAHSTSKIFDAEKFEVSVTPILGDEKQAPYVEIVGNGLLARATVWVDGSRELEALSESFERALLQRSCAVKTTGELDGQLNWWLGEIAIHEANEP